MFKMNQLVVGLFLFLSSLFSCQQKGDFKTVNVEDFDSISVWMFGHWLNIQKDILQKRSI